MELLHGIHPIFFFQVIIGISFVVLGIFLRKYPPKKINHLYGYRTKSSMTSQDRWDHAQSYSSREMIKHGLILAILGVLLGIFTDMEVLAAVVTFLLAIMLSCIALVLRTERSLKDTFS